MLLLTQKLRWLENLGSLLYPGLWCSVWHNTPTATWRHFEVDERRSPTAESIVATHFQGHNTQLVSFCGRYNYTHTHMGSLFTAGVNLAVAVTLMSLSCVIRSVFLSLSLCLPRILLLLICVFLCHGCLYRFVFSSHNLPRSPRPLFLTLLLFSLWNWQVMEEGVWLKLVESNLFTKHI